MVAESIQPRGGEQFSALLRRNRVAAALSQEQLAERAGLSTRAVSDLERGVKTRPYMDTVRRLADALDLPLPDRTALATAARPVMRDVASISETGPSHERSALPIPATELIGREQDLAVIAQLMGEGARLVTLTGAAGIGKTRLALAAAAAAAPTFTAGLVWVELAALLDPELVIDTVVRSLGLREEPGRSATATLRDTFATGCWLLAIDNCEHLRQAVSVLVADLLTTCPGLTVLATSRAPLRLTAEHVFPVLPLAVPADSENALAGIATTAAVRLFERRARMATPTFVLTEANADDVGAICRRLDGLPLAIELAASRVRALSPAALRALLEQRLRVLSGGPSDAPARHRTLWDAIAWSYDLLHPLHQALFRRLAVFAGGCDLGAAAAICTDGDPFVALDGIEVLIDEGLLRRTDAFGSAPRFAMLETIRAFAGERLADTGEEANTKDRHAEYFVALTESGQAQLYGRDQENWLALFDRELDNIRAALEWLSSPAYSDPATATRLTGALWLYWLKRGQHREGLERITRSLERTVGMPSAARANALHGLGCMRGHLGDIDGTRAAFSESLTIWQQLGDATGLARSAMAHGVTELEVGNPELAVPFLEQALAGYKEPDDDAWIGITELHLGRACALIGEGDRAAALCAQAVARQRRIGERWGLMNALVASAEVAVVRGDLMRAEADFSEAIAECDALRDHASMTWPLIGLAEVIRRRGDDARAARLIGAADHLASRARAELRPIQLEQRRRSIDALMVSLGETGFEAERAVGAALSVAEIFADVADQRTGESDT